MIERDLVELILEEHSLAETIEIVNDVIAAVKSNPKLFIKNLRDTLDDTAEFMFSCPACGSDLTVIDTYEEDRGECCGVPCSETMTIIGCSEECGFVAPQ